MEKNSKVIKNYQIDNRVHTIDRMDVESHFITVKNHICNFIEALPDTI